MNGYIEFLTTLQAEGGVTCGTSDPVDAPASGCGLYYRTDTGTVWYWNGSAWIILFGP